MEWYIWGILAIIAFVIEITSPTFFFLFLGIGFSISGLLGYFVPNSLNVQIITAIVGMIISFIIFKRKKIADDNNTKDGQSNELENKTAKVIEEIKEGEKGVVKLEEPFLGQVEWLAKSNDKTIEKDTIVIIKEIHGNVLIVSIKE